MFTRILILVLIAAYMMGCSGERAKKAATTVTKKTVELTKGTVTGIDEGIEEGRKAVESGDGALMVSTREEFEAALEVEILAVRADGAEGTATVEIGFVNDAKQAVRVTELASDGNVILLNSDNYVCKALDLPSEITVPYQAEQRVALIFTCDPGKAAKLRLFGAEYDIAGELPVPAPQ